MSARREELEIEKIRIEIEEIRMKINKMFAETAKINAENHYYLIIITATATLALLAVVKLFL